MAALHIKLLGGFEARRDSGEALALKGRKTQALLAYLALSPGQARSREELVGLLWGDRGEQQARASLRQSLSELRKALGGGEDPPQAETEAPAGGPAAAAGCHGKGAARNPDRPRHDQPPLEKRLPNRSR